VRDAALVGIGKRLSQLCSVAHDHEAVERAGLERFGQGAPLDVLHGDVGQALIVGLSLAHVIDRANVPVVERARQARLLKGLAPGVLAGPVQDLEGHAAVQAHVARQINRAVLPLAQFVIDRVVSNRFRRHIQVRCRQSFVSSFPEAAFHSYT